ncbi:nucleotide exchange factor GrpE [Paractinoplanes rishiriensis]|uniref:Protein GrpE n=1 Tax=Paractinoplanes rishiriensis TaxID=1050105 RepID=A0A919K990_9ACTN|nr:nucleotide exchange factor GrpE [Actinoplanes rishiriensis]GIF00834.1 protein GrpE [Actinoplanes rishiriensis]
MTDQEREPAATGAAMSSGPQEHAAGGAASQVRDETAELRAQLAQSDERYRRAVADYDNLRKRMARDVNREREDERARVAARWLPVLDNLELALKHATAEPASIVSGLEAVRQQALAVLADLGYPLRADLNEAFDPSRHEAVAVLPSTDAAPGTILQIVRPGYGTDERPLRPAAVVVAKDA